MDEDKFVKFVRELYGHAVVNGETFAGYSLEDIAGDMLAYDAFSDMEEPPVERIVAALKANGIVPKE